MQTIRQFFIYLLADRFFTFPIPAKRWLEYWIYTQVLIKYISVNYLARMIGIGLLGMLNMGHKKQVLGYL